MHSDVEIDQSSIRQAEHKAVNTKLLPFFPGLLDKGSTGHIENLLLYVDFHQKFCLLLYCSQVLEGMGVLKANAT